MARKIPWYTMIEWKSIPWIFLVIVLVGCLLSFRYWPDIIRNEKLNTYKIETMALVEEVKENRILSQTDAGNILKIYSYDFSYSYNYKGAVYKGHDVIINTPVNIYTLKEVLNGKSDTVTIRLDQNRPEHSVIRLSH